MPNLSDEEVLAIVDNEFDNAMGKPGDQISNERALSFNRYMGKPLGNEVKGQSQVLTLDVAEVIDGIMPSMLRIFTINDNLLIFEPVSEDDIEAARQETVRVHHEFWKKNEGFAIVWQWVWDALVLKTGTVKAFWDESEDETKETYEGLTEQELALLLDDEELEPEEQEEMVEQVVQPVMTPIGQIPMPVEVSTYNVTFKRTRKRGQVCIEPVPNDEFRISSDAKWNPQSARFSGHETEKTRAELVAMGYDKELIWSLPTSTEAEEGEEKRARRNKPEEHQGLNPSLDESQMLVEYKEAYVRMDYDMDGKAELRQVIIGGNTVLSNEVIDRCPFHTICAKPIPHKHFGQSVAEVVEEIQKINTTLLRQALDNVYHTNRPGHMIWEQAIGDDTLEDLLTTETGRIARVARPVGEAYRELTVPFTASASFEVMQYFDKLKRDRTGVTQDSEMLSPDQLKNIQRGVMSQTIDIARGKIEAIARVFAETGFKSLFLHIHEMLLKHCDKEEIVQIAGSYVPIDPREWRQRYNMTVNVGIGLGSRETNLIHLEAIAAKQAEIFKNGGLNKLVTLQGMFNTLSEIVRNANLKDPERFFLDPSKVPPEKLQPQPDAKDEIAKELVAVEKEKNQISLMKAQLDSQMKQMEMKRKIMELQGKLQMEAQKNQGQFTEAQAKIMVAMEQIANDLTEMELKYGEDVPGSKV